MYIKDVYFKVTFWRTFFLNCFFESSWILKKSCVKKRSKKEVFLKGRQKNFVKSVFGEINNV